MAHRLDPDEPPADICQFAAREVYDFLRIRASLIPLLEHRASPSPLPPTHTKNSRRHSCRLHCRPLFRSLLRRGSGRAHRDLHRLAGSAHHADHPICVRWFTEWALWRAHTAPVPALPSGVASMPEHVYALLRVSDETRNTILGCA